MIVKLFKFIILFGVAATISLFIVKIYFMFSEFIPQKSIASTNIINNSSALSKVIHTPTPNVDHPPQRIRFPILNKELYIQEAYIVNGVWELFTDKVSWLSTSSVPGKGNVILYAHNYPQLFGDLSQLNIGDIIELEQYSDWLTYQIIERRQVLPIETNTILSQDERLTLYTCDGSFDEKRLVIIALRVKS